MAIWNLTPWRLQSQSFSPRPFLHVAQSYTLSMPFPSLPFLSLLKSRLFTVRSRHCRVLVSAARLHPLTDPSSVRPSFPYSLIPTLFHVRKYGPNLRRSSASSTEKRKGKRITAERMLVIDENGSRLGVMNKRAALQLAEGKGLELVQVQKNSPDQEAVCRLVSQKQLWQDNKSKSKRDPSLVVKEIKFTALISEHDLATKIAQIRLNLEKRHTVHVKIEHRRVRRMTVDIPELQRRLLEVVLERVGDIGVKSRQEVWTPRKDILVVLKSTVQTPPQ